MKPGRIGAAATGWLLLILGGVMALIIGKGDATVITAGVFASFGGVYALSLVDPGTRQFIGNGWPERLCRSSAGIMGFLMVVSGLIGLMGGIKEILIFPNLSGLSLVLIGLLPLFWGLYILNLAVNGI